MVILKDVVAEAGISLIRRAKGSWNTADDFIFLFIHFEMQYSLDVFIMGVEVAE